MPFKSQSQRKWAHTEEGKKALGSKLEEYDESSKGLNLPNHVGDRKRFHEFVKDIVRSKK